jgi:hypothetical protein
MHRRRGHDTAAAHAGRGVQRHRAADQRHLRAGGARRVGDGEAHLAGTAIAEEPHRIDGFARGAGGDQHAHASQGAGAAQQRQRLFRQRRRFEHAARAGLATGLIARRRPQNAHAAALEGGDIVLRGRVGPHEPVHGRGHGNGRLCGQAQGAEQVIGLTVGEAGQEIGAGRGHEDQSGPAGQFDVPHGGLGRRIP